MTKNVKSQILSGGIGKEKYSCLREDRIQFCSGYFSASRQRSAHKQTYKHTLL